ncbi:MAG: hypothetical protein AB7I18_00825 [Candidatus Berkiella sp.]
MSHRSPVNQKPTLESVIVGLLEEARQIPINAPDTITAPLVNEFLDYDKALSNLFSVSLESLLSVDLIIEAKGPKEIEERINGLYFVFYRVIPHLSGFNVIQLSGMLGDALLESIEKYRSLRAESTQPSLLEIYDETEFRFKYPGLSPLFEEYANALSSLTENLTQVKAQQISRYTLKRFTDNLDFLLKNTQSLKLPIEYLSKKLDEHIKLVFKISCYIKDCYNKSEAMILLPKIKILLDELAVKLSANENSNKVQLLGKRVKQLAQKTEQARAQLENAVVTAAQLAQPALLTQAVLDETVQSFLNENIISLGESEKLNSLLKDANITRQIASALTKRLTKELASWPDVDKLTLGQMAELLTNCIRPIDLTLYFVNKVLADRPEFALERSNLIYELFAQMTYYFVIANRYFVLREDVNSEALFYFSVLQQYNHALESLTPRYHELSLDKLNASKDKSANLQDRQSNKRQVYEAHHNLLTFKLCYAVICANVHEYDLAHQACRATQQATLGVSAAIDSMDDKIDTENMKRYQVLLTDIQKKLETLVRLIKLYTQTKISALNQDKHIVVFLRKNNTVHSVNVKEMIDSMAKSIDKVTPDENSPEYKKLSKKFSKDTKVYPVRIAMINYVAERSLADSKAKMLNLTRSPHERINRIHDHQKNINALYYFFCTTAKEHVDAFPKADSKHRLLGFIVLNIHMQANEFEKLMLNREVPDGQYAALYKVIRGNYVMLSKHLSNFIEDIMRNQEECVVKLKALLEVQVVQSCIFEQFAESAFAQTCFKQGANILKILNDMHELTPQECDHYNTLLANCKSYELSEAVGIRQFFDDTFNQSSLIHRFLVEFGSDDKKFLQKSCDESAQQRADRLKERLKHSKNNLNEMADILLSLNKDFGLDNVIFILTELNLQFKELKQSYFKKKNGIYGLITETIIGITLDIDVCLSILEKNIELQAIQAEKQAKVNEANRLARAKQDIKREEERLRKEGRKIASTQRQAVAQKTEVTQQAPLLLKEKPKPQQREKQNRQNQPVAEPSIFITQFQEPKLKNKKRRRLEKEKKLEQERQARIAEQKQSQMQQKIAARQNLDHQSLALEAGYLPASAIVIPKKSQIEQQTKVPDTQVKALTDDIAKISLKDVSPQPLHEEFPSIKQRADHLALFFTPERLRSRLSHLPDEAYKVNGLQIPLDTNVKAVLELFHSHGVRAYLYGGYPRDALLGREPHDADFVVFCTPQKAKEILGARFKDNANHEKQFVFEGADVRCEDGTLSLWDFAQERDITINAILVDEDGNIYAPILRSIKDLYREELYSIGNSSQTYKDDPRRMFRLIRQSHELQSKLSESQEVALLENADLLTALPFNQYAMHFSSLFIRGAAWLNVRYVIKLRLLGSLLPPLKVIDYADTDTLSWYESECMKVDRLYPDGAKTYSFNMLIAIFLAPLLVKGFKEGIYSFEEKVEKVILSFNEVFPNQSEADKNILSALLKSYYLQYLGHLHQQLERRVNPQAYAGMAYSPQHESDVNISKRAAFKK